MAATPLLRFSLLPPQTLPKPFLSSQPLLRSTPLLHLSSPPRTTAICSYQRVPATDRLISSLSYFLPFFNGLQYGRYLFVQYPSLAIPLQPLFPLLNAYRSIPYASFVAFFALYLGVVRNPSFSRYVRFNSMQAVVLDVLLSLPLLFQRILNPSRGVGLSLVVMGYNAIFVFILGCFVYSVGCSVFGRTPYFPLVASAADRQL